MRSSQVVNVELGFLIVRIYGLRDDKANHDRAISHPLFYPATRCYMEDDNPLCAVFQYIFGRTRDHGSSIEL